MTKLWAWPSDKPRPAPPPSPPIAYVRFRSGRVMTVVQPDPDELIRLWREQSPSPFPPPNGPRQLVVREKRTSGTGHVEYDVTIDLNAIEAIQTYGGTE